MALFDDRTRSEIEKILGKMQNPVHLVVFTQQFECDSCHDARALVEELGSVSDRISHEVLDFVEQTERARALGVDKVPAVVVDDGSGRAIRFYGVPGGYEFTSLLDAVVMVSRGDSGLSPASRDAVKGIDKPVHLQVLVTPT